jgi:Peptidase family C25
VQKNWARMPLFLLLLAAIRLGLPCSPGVDAAPTSARIPGLQPTVYVARGLAPESLAVLSAMLAGRDPSAVLLLDTNVAAPANKAFLTAFKPPRIVPIGNYTEDSDQLEERFGFRPDTPYHWTSHPPRILWRDFYPRAESVVVCPPSPRGLLLQAACLAGTLKAPLYVWHGHDFESNDLQSLLLRWQTRNVYLLGSAAPLPFELAGLQVTQLKTTREVALAHCRRLAEKEPIRTLVIANPADVENAERKAMLAMKDDEPHAPQSPLAAWVALQRKAGLVLTNREGNDVDDTVTEAIRRKDLRKVETLILVADLEAIPPQKRGNPVKGDKDEHIEMEPMTPSGRDPFSFSVGRLFHEDLAVVPLMLAREHLLARQTGTRRALVASNAAEGLSLLETISRHTVRELTNSGFETTGLFGKKATLEALRGGMPKNDVFVWEGHHNLLINDWKFSSWDEPLPPGLVFLQSCLALKEWKVEQLFRRGSVGVIGSSTRTYSASGGAASLAFFNAILHEDLSMGAGLRRSKNFMLAYTMLKEKRMGADAKKPGASLRAAWAFTLWGDPTLKLPTPERPTTAAPPVTHSVKRNTIVVHLPAEKLDPVHSDKYHAQGPSNTFLAGFLNKEKGDDGQGLLPMVFVEVPLPRAPEGKTPRLSSKLPSRSWVFNWDARRRCGYLLAVPRPKDKEALQFNIHWEEATTSAPGAMRLDEENR